MGYTTDSGMVRVDFFKPSGKWYMTEAIDMSETYNDWDTHKCVRLALDESRAGLGPGWWRHFTVVVLKPYSQYAYPIMIVAEDTE